MGELLLMEEITYLMLLDTDYHKLLKNLLMLSDHLVQDLLKMLMNYHLIPIIMMDLLILTLPKLTFTLSLSLMNVTNLPFVDGVELTTPVLKELLFPHKNLVDHLINSLD